MMRRVSRALAAVLMAALILPSQTARASEEPVLLLDGQVSGGSLDLTRSELEALGLVTIVTRTPWEDGIVTYEGVRLDVLMQRIGAEGKHAYVVALNDYSTVVPLADFEQYGPILATRRNGAHMAVSEKGPFFIIYPFDDRPELNRELYWSRSAWQVARISIE